jgi:mono/diheme cytochrome c family protein
LIMPNANRAASFPRRYLAHAIGSLFCFLFCFSGLLHGQEGRVPALPEGDGKQLVATVCSQCHGLRQTQILRDGQNGWQETVDRMVLYGAQLTPPESTTVVHYLAVQLGPGTDPMRTGALPAGGAKDVSLPAGAGKDLVQARCVLCHDLGRVVGSTRSKADWEAITNNMVGRGLKATPADIQTMISYLSAQFGK